MVFKSKNMTKSLVDNFQKKLFCEQIKILDLLHNWKASIISRRFRGCKNGV